MEDTTQSHELGYDMYYISRAFHKEAGITINEYIMKAKIERAKIMLRTTKMSIQEISDSLLFSSTAYFCAKFKKETGKTPVSFRRYS